MTRFSSRLSRLSIATAIALIAATPALAEPALLKLGGVEGESTDDKHKGEIQVESFSWGAVGVHSSDPEEGGEVTPSMDSSDPQEGGEVASATRPTLSDIPIVKRPDKDTPVLQSSDPEEGGEVAAKLPGMQKQSNIALKRGTAQSVIPKAEVVSPRDPATGLPTGKRQHKPLTMERGSLTAIVPDGACVLGARYPTVTLQADGQVYELSDVTVSSCAPVATRKGKKDKAQLDYMIVKMETVLISG